MASAARISPSHRPKMAAAMTRSKSTRSWMPPASGWPRWRRPTGQKKPLENGEILTDGPNGPTQQVFKPPPEGRATRRRRSTRSDKRFATSSLGSGNPRSHKMRPTTSGSGWPGAAAATCTRLTPSVMKPNRGWRQCGQPTGDDATDGDRSRLSQA